MTKEYMFLVYRWVKSFQNSGSIFSQKIHIQTKEKKQNLFSNLELLKNTINAHISNQTKLAREIELLNEKQKELKGLENVKGKYTKLHDSIKEQEQLKEYHIRKERLLEEQKNLREHYKKSKDTINILEQESSLHGELVKKEKELLGIQEEIKQELIKLNQKEKELVQEIAGEEKLIADINKKIQNIKNLGRDSNCPTCTRPLLDEYDNVISSLEAIVKTAQEQKISKTKEELEKLGMLKTAQEQIQKQNSTEYFEVSKSLNLCESKKRDLFIEKEHFVKVEAQGMKNKEELAKLEIYTYDNTIHQNLIEKQKELKVKYEYVLSLETILKRADALKQEYTNTNANIEKLSKEYNEKELSYKEINYDEVKHKEKQKQFDEVQVLKEQELNLLNELKVQIATIQGQIKNIQETLDNNEIQLAKVQTKKDDLQDYEKIKISLAEFKTKLNSKVAPRISDIASNMFAQITKGKYQHIEVSNDFDFYIYDEGKKYPIERFSGGEIDLANLVLRIAISKTLSELSGASSVEFLAFDEVFGSQDDSRRIEILEAFHTIKEQYRQIFLISHEMEIKEMFERVVEV
jgi:exonuclease SbcC